MSFKYRESGYNKPIASEPSHAHRTSLPICAHYTFVRKNKHVSFMHTVHLSGGDRYCSGLNTLWIRFYHLSLPVHVLAGLRYWRVSLQRQEKSKMSAFISMRFARNLQQVYTSCTSPVKGAWQLALNAGRIVALASRIPWCRYLGNCEDCFELPRLQACCFTRKLTLL